MFEFSEEEITGLVVKPLRNLRQKTMQEQLWQKNREYMGERFIVLTAQGFKD